jgi:hypothetical protein
MSGETEICPPAPGYDGDRMVHDDMNGKVQERTAAERPLNAAQSVIDAGRP